MRFDSQTAVFASLASQLPQLRHCIPSQQGFDRAFLVGAWLASDCIYGVCIPGKSVPTIQRLHPIAARFRPGFPCGSLACQRLHLWGLHPRQVSSHNPDIASHCSKVSTGLPCGSLACQRLHLWGLHPRQVSSHNPDIASHCSKVSTGLCLWESGLPAIASMGFASQASQFLLQSVAVTPSH